MPANAYGGYTHLARPDREGGKPLQLAIVLLGNGSLLGARAAQADQGRAQGRLAHRRRGMRIVRPHQWRPMALYKVEDAIRGSDPDRRRAVRQELSRPLVDDFFAWLTAQAARVSRKSDLGVALAYMLRRQDGFRLFLADGHVDIDSNLVETPSAARP